MDSNEAIMENENNSNLESQHLAEIQSSSLNTDPEEPVRNLYTESKGQDEEPTDNVNLSNSNKLEEANPESSNVTVNATGVEDKNTVGEHVEAQQSKSDELASDKDDGEVDLLPDREQVDSNADEKIQNQEEDIPMKDHEVMTSDQIPSQEEVIQEQKPKSDSVVKNSNDEEGMDFEEQNEQEIAESNTAEMIEDKNEQVVAPVENGKNTESAEMEAAVTETMDVDSNVSNEGNGNDENINIAPDAETAESNQVTSEEGVSVIQQIETQGGAEDEISEVNEENLLSETEPQKENSIAESVVESKMDIEESKATLEPTNKGYTEDNLEPASNDNAEPATHVSEDNEETIKEHSEAALNLLDEDKTESTSEIENKDIPTASDKKNEGEAEIILDNTNKENVSDLLDDNVETASEKTTKDDGEPASDLQNKERAEIAQEETSKENAEAALDLLDDTDAEIVQEETSKENAEAASDLLDDTDAEIAQEEATKENADAASDLLNEDEADIDSEATTQEKKDETSEETHKDKGNANLDGEEKADSAVPSQDEADTASDANKDDKEAPSGESNMDTAEDETTSEKVNAETSPNVTISENAETEGTPDKENESMQITENQDNENEETNTSMDESVMKSIKKEKVDNAESSEAKTESVNVKREPEPEKALKAAGDVVVLDDDEEGSNVKKEKQAPPKSTESKTETQTTKPAGTKKTKGKGKNQTCIVCQKVGRCKYNIVRNGDVKHLCDDVCFKKFRASPSQYLKYQKEAQAAEAEKAAAAAAAAAAATAEAQKSAAAKSTPGAKKSSLNLKTCAVCQLMNVNQFPFCNWQGLDFCGETCLGKFQSNLPTSCSFCKSFVAPDHRTALCLKVGNEVKSFCKPQCYSEFKRLLKHCGFCQTNLAGVSGSIMASVGGDGKFKDFCSKVCQQKLAQQLKDLEVTKPVDSVGPMGDSTPCAVCQKVGPIKHKVRIRNKENPLCSDPCLSAFQYSNKIDMSKCDNCGTLCTVEEAQAHCLQFEGQMKRFCGDSCSNAFRSINNKMTPCTWCSTTKPNFDMIERLDTDNKFQLFCTLNCLSLYRVNLQAKSNQAVSCDNCKKTVPAQYHLTMSDASVRNFCSYSCVMAFQAQFQKPQSATLGPSAHLQQQKTTSAQPTQQTRGRGGRIGTRQAAGSNDVIWQLMNRSKDKERATCKHCKEVFIVHNSTTSILRHLQRVHPKEIKEARKRLETEGANGRGQEDAMPVISSVVSLAPAPQKIQPAPVQTMQIPPGIIATADLKERIMMTEPPAKTYKNKQAQCKPVTQTKATSCRPHAISKETQTDEIPPEKTTIFVPIPVPIYIPMPCAMYSTPVPVLLPIPVPIPVPMFIPTTRKSANGIMRAIKDIVTRIPADPLEAELLMMAEAVSADTKGDSDTDEYEGNDDFGPPVDDDTPMTPPVKQEDTSMVAKKKEGGEEDMIQMALRMAEEMSGPIEDLEASVEPVAVNNEPPPAPPQPEPMMHQQQMYSPREDDEYMPHRGRGRGAKRPNRGRAPASRPKRQRVERSYAEMEQAVTSIVQQPPPKPLVQEPPADANYRLKFTYGVNAWQHWVINKNAEIEKTKQATGVNRMRPFPTDILKTTTDQLNFTLCMFIKEVRKPNSEEYSPDSVYYLCLGIQQYLYENGRIDNIFTDLYFDRFTDTLHDVLKMLKPKVNSHGQTLCRIEEEHLWESKQLGAHSPYVLLNTLIYFHTKHFILKTAQEHMSLSFAQILKHLKKGMPGKNQPQQNKNVALRYYCLANGKKGDNGLAARKSKEGVPVYEVTENFENPLRCPVKLYEFFLSKCPESIKNRHDIFYPVPERSCVPDSPVWYSTMSIEQHTMDKMLKRILLVREIQESHLHAQPIYL